MYLDQGPLLLGITIFTLVLGGLFILARVIVRTTINPHFGLDDVFIIVTWFLVLGFNVSYFSAISHGYGKHSTELSPDQLVLAARASVVGEFFAVFSYPTGKAAVAYLLMRLFPGRKLQWFLWTIVAANALLFYLNGIFFFAQCTPAAYQWDRSIGGHCWSPAVIADWGYLTGVIGALTDLVFAVVPWFYIAKLQMPLRRKLIVGIALGMGLLPFICSVLKIQYTATLAAHADPTYDTVPLVLTSASELCAINIAACVPTLRPLWLYLTGRNDTNNTKDTSVYTPEYRRRSYVPRRLGPFSLPTWLDNDDAATRIDSSEHLEGHILHERTYDVSIETRRGSEMEEAKAEHANTTTVDVGRAV